MARKNERTRLKGGRGEEINNQREREREAGRQTDRARVQSYRPLQTHRPFHS